MNVIGLALAILLVIGGLIFLGIRVSALEDEVEEARAAANAALYEPHCTAETIALYPAECDRFAQLERDIDALNEADGVLAKLLIPNDCEVQANPDAGPLAVEEGCDRISLLGDVSRATTDVLTTIAPRLERLWRSNVGIWTTLCSTPATHAVIERENPGGCEEHLLSLQQ